MGKCTLEHKVIVVFRRDLLVKETVIRVYENLHVIGTQYMFNLFHVFHGHFDGIIAFLSKAN